MLFRKALVPCKISMNISPCQELSPISVLDMIRDRSFVRPPGRPKTPVAS
jgi:hypothetical protein